MSVRFNPLPSPLGPHSLVHIFKLTLLSGGLLLFFSNNHLFLHPCNFQDLLPLARTQPWLYSCLQITPWKPVGLSNPYPAPNFTLSIPFNSSSFTVLVMLPGERCAEAPGCSQSPLCSHLWPLPHYPQPVGSLYSTILSAPSLLLQLPSSIQLRLLS